MKVKARVWDASVFSGKGVERVLVDTNIWLGMYFEEVTQGQAGDVYANYMDAIEKILNNGGTLYWSAFSYAEIANVIEGYYFKVYKELSGNDVSKKRYRHEMPRERLKVVTKAQQVWGEITATGKPLGDYVVGSYEIADLDIDYRNYAVDPYDLFLIRSIKEAGISYVITNDQDFVTVPGIDVITSHEKSLKVANSENMLQIEA